MSNPFMLRQPSSRVIATQTTAITSGTISQAVTNAFSSQTRQIRASWISTATGGAWLKIGDGAQTAAATDVWIPPNWTEYFTVTPGQSCAFISTSTSSGLFNVAEFE